MMMGSRNNRSGCSTFTANQWQELEQQVLIFKHMVGGIPIPPDLLSTVRKSMDSSRFFPHQQSIGWGCFQMGFGRKIDPEPGRCRRTDGKKWRCSKEAHPESKYCERHMHRGKNRSRKPVEVPTALPTNAATNAAYAHPYSLSAANHQPITATTNNPYLYPQSTSLKPPPGSFLSPQGNNNSTTQHLFLDSGPNYSHTDRTTSYLYGDKDDADERSFFPEASGTVRSLKDSFTPLTMSSNNAYTQLQQRQQQQEKQCFVLGTDFKSAGDDREEENQKPFHQFFGEWPQKNREYSWLDIEENQTRHEQSYTTQQHSMPTQDLFGSKNI